MPAFGERLRDDEAWALIDFMKAQGAGQTCARPASGRSRSPCPMSAVRCEGAAAAPACELARAARAHRGAADARRALLEDPRLVTVLLAPPTRRRQRHAADCVADSGCRVGRASSLIAGTDQLGRHAR